MNSMVNPPVRALGRLVCGMLAVTTFVAAVAQEPPKRVQAPNAVAVNPQEPASQPAAPKPEGPMRVEFLGVFERRTVWAEPVPERAAKSDSKMYLKLMGEKLPELYRCGRAVIEELVDDTGAKLFDATTQTDKDKAATLVVNVAQSVQQFGFHALEVTALPSARAAKKIATLKGYVNIVFGGATEEIAIENPLQYQGRVVDHPKLKELGINVKVLKLGGEEAAEPNDGRGIALVIEPSDEQVKSVEFFDDNFKKVTARPGDRKSEKVESYKYYALAGAAVNTDTQMVLTVFKRVEKQRLDFSLKDVALP